MQANLTITGGEMHLMAPSTESDPSLLSRELHPPYFLALETLLQELRHYPTATLVLDSGDIERFQCSQCGVCCTLPWNIFIEKSYYDRWYAIFDQDPSGRFKDPFIRQAEGREENYAQIRRKPGSAHCIFLDEDQRCHIHRTQGESALPYVCKTYPRAHIRHPLRYGADYLLGSCQSAPHLLLQPHPLKARFEIADLAQGLPLQRPAHSYPEAMPIPSTYLWIGLCLDVISLEVNTPLQRLASLSYSLELLSEQDLSQIQPETLRYLYREQMRISSQPCFTGRPRAAQREALLWFFQILEPNYLKARQYAREIWQGERQWPVLTEAEQKLLNSFLQAWIVRRLLILPYEDPFFGHLNLYQKLFALSLFLLMIQLLSHFYSRHQGQSLAAQDLKRALNFVEGRYLQRGNWPHSEQIDTLPAASCIENMQTALALDLGHAWPDALD